MSEERSEERTPRPRELALCPCKSRKSYGTCCHPFHLGKAKPETAELLMRSRYSAYFFRRVDYLVETTHPDTRAKGLREELLKTIEQSQWSFLTIVKQSKGQKDDKMGKVEFVAEYYLGGEKLEMKENSRFKRHKGNWKYLDGKG